MGMGMEACAGGVDRARMALEALASQALSGPIVALVQASRYVRKLLLRSSVCPGGKHALGADADGGDSSAGGRRDARTTGDETNLWQFVHFPTVKPG